MGKGRPNKPRVDRRARKPYWDGNLRFRGVWEPQHRDEHHPLGQCTDPEHCQCPQPFLVRLGPAVDEALFGGASGGGKSDLLIAEGARYAHHPRYRGYLFRRTYPELARLLDRAKEIYFAIEPGCQWVEREKEFRWPSGAIIRARHMEEADDWRKYQGHEIHYAGWDELTQFLPVQYKMIKAWVRSSVPGITAYTRATSNPRGVGHAHAKARFVDQGPYKLVTETVEDPTTHLTYSRTRVFVPATVYDNRYYRDDPGYMGHLLQMPEADRKAFFYGIWEGGEGQFFAEWNAQLHTIQEYQPSGRRFGMVDYGFATPFCYLQADVTKDGQVVVYKEIYRHGIRDDEQAERIYELCKDDKPEYVVAGKDLWHKSGKGQHGQSTAETYRNVWNKRGFNVPLRMGDNDRVMGWRRIRLYLQPYQSGSGERTAMLRVVAPNCPHLCRTLPELQYDLDHPDDVLQAGPGYYMDGGSVGEDHAPEALRLGLMSRPAPKVPVVQLPGPFDAVTLIKQYLRDRKKPNRIGSESEVRA